MIRGHDGSCLLPQTGSAVSQFRSSRFVFRVSLSAVRGYLRAALYSSVALSQFTTFHQASM